MATGHVTVSSAGAVIPEIWSPEIERAAHEVRAFTGKIQEYGFNGPGDVLHIPKIGSIAAAAFTGTVAYTYNTETTVDITPDISYAAVQVDDKANRRALMELGNMYQYELGQGLADYEDTQIASLYSGLSIYTGGAENIDADKLLAGVAALVINGKDQVTLGNTQVWGVFHPAMYDHLLGASGIVSAAVRGEPNGPVVTGAIDLVYGVSIVFSGNVQVSTTARNLLFVQKAFAIARKINPDVESMRDIDTLSLKIVASQDFGVAELNDNLAVDVRTNAA